MSKSREKIRKLTIQNHLRGFGPDYKQYAQDLVSALGGSISNDNVNIPGEQPLPLIDFFKKEYYHGFYDSIEGEGFNPHDEDSFDKTKYSIGFYIGEGMIQGYELCSRQVKGSLEDLERKLG